MVSFHSSISRSVWVSEEPISEHVLARIVLLSGLLTLLLLSLSTSLLALLLSIEASVRLCSIS